MTVWAIQKWPKVQFCPCWMVKNNENLFKVKKKDLFDLLFSTEKYIFAFICIFCWISNPKPDNAFSILNIKSPSKIITRTMAENKWNNLKKAVLIYLNLVKGHNFWAKKNKNNKILWLNVNVVTIILHINSADLTQKGSRAIVHSTTTNGK